MPKSSLPEWNLNDLFTGLDSKDFKDSFKNLETLKNNFIKNRKTVESEKYNSKELLKFIREYEDIQALILHMYAYTHMQYDTDTKNEKAKIAHDKVKTFVAQISSELEYFALALKKMSQKKMKEMISSKEIKSYKHLIEVLKIFEKYTLSEKEEQLIIFKDVNGASAWGQFHTELASTQDYGTMKIEGKETKLNQAIIGHIVGNSTNQKERKEAYENGRMPFMKNNNLYAFAFNSVLADNEQEIRSLRKYKSGLERATMGEEVTIKCVESMIKVVESKISTFQNFYKLKQKLLKYKEFHTYDLKAPITTKRPKIEFAKAEKIVLDCFGKFDKEFAEKAELFFTKKWIDAREGDNKYAGAYSWSMEMHPYILLNYKPNYGQVFTMIHELGHGVHGLFSKENQPFIMRDSSKVLAECASQFSEILLLDYLSNIEKDKEVLNDLLVTHIDDILYCLFSTITVTKFEIATHEKVLEGGLTSNYLSGVWEDLHKELYGKVIKMTENDKYAWARIPHIFQMPFYYYNYPMSMIVVLALYEKYLSNKSDFVNKYKQILKAGGSIAPMELLKNVMGIDLSKEETYKKAFNVVEKMISKVKGER